MTRPDRRSARIWAIAGPAILANSSAPLVGLMDTWVLASFTGTTAIAAVGAGATVFSFILWAFSFLRMGTTGMVAQATGQNDAGLINQLTVQSVIIGLVFGLVVILASPLLMAACQALLQLPAAVDRVFETYFTIRVLASPITLAIYGITGVLLGQQRARSVLVLQLVLNIANGCFNVAFVVGLGMGANGIALGTVLAEGLTLFAGTLLILRRVSLQDLIDALKNKATWSPFALKRLISVNSLIFIRTVLLLSVFFWMTRASAPFGEDALAATHVFNTFLLLIALGLDAFAYAGEALAGAAYGKKDRAEFLAWSRAAGAWSLGAATLYSLAFWLVGPTFISILIPEPESPVSALLLRVHWLLIIMPLIGVWSYILDGLYIAATAGAGMAGTMGVAAVFYFIILPSLSEIYGVIGIWFAIGLFLIVRAMAQGLWFPKILPKEKAVS